MVWGLGVDSPESNGVRLTVRVDAVDKISFEIIFSVALDLEIDEEYPSTWNESFRPVLFPLVIEAPWQEQNIIIGRMNAVDKAIAFRWSSKPDFFMDGSFTYGF
jgi:hypothetical protein